MVISLDRELHAFGIYVSWLIDQFWGIFWYPTVSALPNWMFINFIAAVFHVEEISVHETDPMKLSPIQGEDAEIIIPIREVLVGLESGAEVRMAALLFRNMSGLLPESIDHEDRYKPTYGRVHVNYY